MAFPLQTVTVADLKELCQALWDWKLCEDCQFVDTRTRHCREADCDWAQRSERLGPFFEFYREVTCSYVPDFFGDDDQALRSHRDLFEIIRLTRKYGHTIPRKLCMREHFDSRNVNRQSLVPQTDQDRAFVLVVRVLTMTTVCVGSPDLLLQGNDDEEKSSASAIALWPLTKCLQDSMVDLFPPRIHPSLQASGPEAAGIKASLSAENLKKIAGLRIEGTDNLLDHLKLDNLGVLRVFHHTTFLKEVLLATKPGSMDNRTDSERSPCLPRNVVLETLYTLQVLFPPGGKSQAILRNLVSKQDFDPDSLRYGTAVFELPQEKKSALCFPIWGTRLMDLHDEVENPKPRGAVDAWLERRSQSRHIMLATMIGVFTAVVLGLLGLCVSIFQTWIAWQEWNSPKFVAVGR